MRNELRILLVNEKGWLFGGVERYVNDIAAGLAESGHRVALLSSEPCPEGREPLDAPFEAVLRLDPDASDAAQRAGLDDLMGRFRPEVAYLHRPPRIAAVDDLADRLPTVRFVHDHDLYCPRRHKYFPYPTRTCDRRMGLSCVLRGCLLTRQGPIQGLPGVADLPGARRRLAAARRLDRLVVGSPWMRDSLVANGCQAERLVVIPPVPRGLERPPGPPGEEPLVLYVGQVVRGKGVDLLLRALTVVHTPHRLLVAGTGNHLPACIALARTLGLGDRVGFLGWVPHERLDAYRRRARVVAVPSRWPEPFGMVGVEAMWASRPVVGFAVGGIPSWLSDGITGLAAPEADWRALGQALDRLLGDLELAARLGAAGHRAASERFRFADQVEATAAVLSEAVEAQRGRTASASGS